jgi:membrane dipeptidase
MRIVDAHLDLAYNATRGRDPRMPAKDQPVADNEIATVGLPDLRQGGVRLICATIFCRPAGYGKEGYSTSEEARSQALSQSAWYRSLARENLIEIVRDRAFHLADDPSAPTKAILLLEGADSLRSPDDVSEFFAADVRIIGLSWRNSFYAGGTGHPGPITASGQDLVRAFDRCRMIHDMSHLAEESFFQLLSLTDGPVIASHSNCRQIVGGGDRHLSDDMIQAIIRRDGIIGINFYDQFLLPADEYGKRRATLQDVIAHIRRICDLAGDARHVGLGTDMDGGLGRNEIPAGIESSADLSRLAQALAEAGFDAHECSAIMSDNWIRFFRQNLPGRD